MSNQNDQKRAPSTPHIPKCTVKGRPIDIKLALTEDESKEVLAVQFEITGECDSKGKLITERFYFTSAAIDQTFKSMKAMGWQGVDPTDFKGMDKEVILVIEHEADERNGGQRSRVRWVNALGINVSKPLEGKRLSDFRARVGASAAKAAGATGAKTGSLPPIDDRGAPPPGDNDVPPWARQ